MWDICRADPMSTAPFVLFCHICDTCNRKVERGANNTLCLPITKILGQSPSWPMIIPIGKVNHEKSTSGDKVSPYIHSLDVLECQCSKFTWLHLQQPNFSDLIKILQNKKYVQFDKLHQPIRVGLGTNLEIFFVDLFVYLCLFERSKCLPRPKEEGARTTFSLFTVCHMSSNPRPLSSFLQASSSRLRRVSFSWRVLRQIYEACIENESVRLLGVR